MFFTGFYAAVIPCGLIFAILELIAYYWILKYNLLRRSIVKYCIGAELSRELTELYKNIKILYLFIINISINNLFIKIELNILLLSML